MVIAKSAATRLPTSSSLPQAGERLGVRDYLLKVAAAPSTIAIALCQSIK